MKVELGFAYGSNTDLDDVDRWCRAHGFPTGMFEVAGSAFLPDRALAFTRRSTARGGGVLDVRKRVGAVTHGLLLRARHADAWRMLDAKEGVAHDGYRRLDTLALRLDGSAVAVRTYEVVAPVAFVEPAPNYLALVEAAFARHGLDGGALERAARNQDGAATGATAGAVFVYGTLMSGETRAHAMHPPEHAICEAVCAGELRVRAHGRYPELFVVAVPDDGDDGGAGARSVIGELHGYAALDVILPSLDDIEGFGGFDRGDNLYERRLVDVRVGERYERAWTYVVVRREGERIASGSWRAHVAARGVLR